MVIKRKKEERKRKIESPIICICIRANNNNIMKTHIYMFAHLKFYKSDRILLEKSSVDINSAFPQRLFNV